MKNKLMMTSASSVALIAGAAHQGLAQDALLPSGYTLNIQGAYGRLNNPYVDKYEGAPSEFQEKIGDANSDNGYIGSVSLGRQLAPNQDMAFALTVGGSVDNDITRTEEGSGYTETSVRSNDLSFAALDIELGRTIPMQAADGRLFYGARALYSNSEQEKLGRYESNGNYDEVTEGVTSEYVGLGPRVGVGFATKPVVGQIGFSGELGAAILVGERTDTYTSKYSYGGSGSSYSSSYSSGFSEKTNVASLDAQLGMDYYVSPTSKISVGYQLQQLWNVDTTSDEDDFEDIASPRIIHGAFVGFTTTF